MSPSSPRRSLDLSLSPNFVLPFYVVVGRTDGGRFRRPARLWVRSSAGPHACHAGLRDGCCKCWPSYWQSRLAAYLAYWLTTGGHPQLGAVSGRLQGYIELTFAGILFAPWIAVGALVRQRDTFAREQATAFALERSELERRALDARFRLLQAQVEPHFLFNTLANVQALVEVGAPQAAKVLKSLIAYLRAAYRGCTKR